MNLLQTLEAEQIAKFLESKSIPEFRAGDTLKVRSEERRTEL